jgi:hypothetical protein
MRRVELWSVPDPGSWYSWSLIRALFGEGDPLSRLFAHKMGCKRTTGRGAQLVKKEDRNAPY